MGVGLDVAGDEGAAGGVDDLGARPHHVVAGSDIGDALALDRHAGRVALPRVDVEEEAAPDDAVRHGIAPRPRHKRRSLLRPHGRDYPGGAANAQPESAGSGRDQAPARARPTTLKAGTGREKPLRVSSPTGSAVARSPAAARNRRDTRTWPGRASPQTPA